MVVTEKDIAVVKTVADSYVVTGSQVHRNCFPTHSDGRATRKRLSRLVAAGYIAKTATPIAFPTGNSGPAYDPAQTALALLHSYFDDDSHLAVNVQAPRKDLLFHWLAVSEYHMIVRTHKDKDGFQSTSTSTTRSDAWRRLQKLRASTRSFAARSTVSFPTRLLFSVPSRASLCRICWNCLKKFVKVCSRDTAEFEPVASATTRRAANDAS
jgi:hypothetical protein